MTSVSGLLERPEMITCLGRTVWQVGNMLIWLMPFRRKNSVFDWFKLSKLPVTGLARKTRYWLGSG